MPAPTATQIVKRCLTAGDSLNDLSADDLWALYASQGELDAHVYELVQAEVVSRLKSGDRKRKKIEGP